MPGFLTVGLSTAGVVTSEMLAPITTNFEANMGVLLPVGITIMGVMIGVSLIPRIIWKFI